MVECFVYTEKVIGSSPVPPTLLGYGQVVRHSILNRGSACSIPATLNALQLIYIYMYMSNISTFDKLSNLTVYSNSKNNNEVFNTNPFSVNVYIIAPRQELRALAAFLKLNSLTRVTNAIDITVVDSINNELRFNINYQLQSSTTNMR
jgi:hypothetical protein